MLLLDKKLYSAFCWFLWVQHFTQLNSPFILLFNCYFIKDKAGNKLRIVNWGNQDVKESAFNAFSRQDRYASVRSMLSSCLKSTVMERRMKAEAEPTVTVHLFKEQPTGQMTHTY